MHAKVQHGNKQGDSYMSDGKSTKNKVTVVVSLLILACLAVVVINVWRAKHREVTRVEKTTVIPVTISPAITGELDWFTDVTGDLTPIQSAALYAKVPGKIIEEIFVEKGDWVEKGQLVASLEKDQITANLNRGRAVVEVAQTSVDVLEKDFRRIENLYKSKAAPKQKLDHIQAELDVAGARLKEAQAALKELDVLFRDHDIYATQSGIVADRFVDPGNMSNSKAPILTISNEKVLKVELTVPEIEFSNIREDLAVTFVTDACPGRTFSGKVALIYPTVDPMTRTIKAEVHIKNDDMQLRSGMFAHVRLYFGKKQALLIQREGLNKMPGTGSYYVYAVKEGKARIKNIETGIFQGNRVEVLSGLAEGDQVVIQGQNRLRDNIAVEIIQNKDVEKKPGDMP
jgi:RND family efflux transporter MFP subunit